MESIGGIIAAMTGSTCGDAATGEAVAGPQHVSTPAPCAALPVGADAYLLSEPATLFTVPALRLILTMCDTLRSLQMQAFQTDDSVPLATDVFGFGQGEGSVLCMHPCGRARTKPLACVTNKNVLLW